MNEGKRILKSLPFTYERGVLVIVVDYYYTKCSYDLAIPLFRTASGQRSFAYRSVKIWNDLDDSLKSSLSVVSFKKKRSDSLLGDVTAI